MAPGRHTASCELCWPPSEWTSPIFTISIRSFRLSLIALAVMRAWPWCRRCTIFECYVPTACFSTSAVYASPVRARGAKVLPSRFSHRESAGRGHAISPETALGGERRSLHCSHRFRAPKIYRGRPIHETSRGQAELRIRATFIDSHATERRDLYRSAQI